MNRRSTLPAKLEAVGGQARTGADGLLDDLNSARRELLSARHPTYHRVLGSVVALVSEDDDALVARFERSWRSRAFPTFYERPLLVLAALRADALLEGPAHPLHAAIAAEVPDPNVATQEAVAASLARDRLGVWSTLTTRRVQTNDTSRAIAWLWAASLAGCDGGRRPLALADIGASAGLNLIGDQLPNMWTDLATGRPLGCASRVNTVTRIGFDSRPLDAKDEDAVRWMRACIWPGESDRLSRFEASVKAMRAAATRPSPPIVERLTASLIPQRLEALASSMPAETLLLAYQTLLSGYLEATERDSYRKGMMDLISRRAAGRAVWLELELDDGRRKLPAVLVAHVRVDDGVKTLRMGRCSQHPSEVEVDAAGVAELQRQLGSG